MRFVTEPTTVYEDLTVIYTVAFRCSVENVCHAVTWFTASQYIIATQNCIYGLALLCSE